MERLSNKTFHNDHNYLLRHPYRWRGNIPRGLSLASAPANVVSMLLVSASPEAPSSSASPSWTNPTKNAKPAQEATAASLDDDRPAPQLASATWRVRELPLPAATTCSPPPLTQLAHETPPQCDGEETFAQSARAAHTLSSASSSWGADAAVHSPKYSQPSQPQPQPQLPDLIRGPSRSVPQHGNGAKVPPGVSLTLAAVALVLLPVFVLLHHGEVAARGVNVIVSYLTGAAASTAAAARRATARQVGTSGVAAGWPGGAAAVGFMLPLPYELMLPPATAALALLPLLLSLGAGVAAAALAAAAGSAAAAAGGTAAGAASSLTAAGMGEAAMAAVSISAASACISHPSALSVAPSSTAGSAALAWLWSGLPYALALLVPYPGPGRGASAGSASRSRGVARHIVRQAVRLLLVLWSGWLVRTAAAAAAAAASTAAAAAGWECTAVAWRYAAGAFWMLHTAGMLQAASTSA